MGGMRLFGPIRKVTVSAAIAERIRNEIATGKLKPGDRLPPERELARQLGVSRISLREAIQSLVALGLLEVRPGAGTFVKRTTAGYLDPALVDLANWQSLAELMEARLVLEMELAGLAARRATPEELEAIRAAMERYEAACHRGSGTVEADLEFHSALGRAAHNSVLLRMYETTSDLTRRLRERTAAVPGAAEESMVAHRRIFERIQARDAAGARREMRRHLEVVTRHLQAAFAQGWRSP